MFKNKRVVFDLLNVKKTVNSVKLYLNINLNLFIRN